MRKYHQINVYIYQCVLQLTRMDRSPVDRINTQVILDSIDSYPIDMPSLSLLAA